MPWRTLTADVDEEALLLAEPLAAAVNVAVAKAQAVTPAHDEVVVAADTLVVTDRHILGKPADADDARRMLLQLRDRDHHVMTGIALATPLLEWAGIVDTRVIMRSYTSDEIETYIARGEPFDKAGAYAIQDEEFHPVARIEGCYLNVVGLPLCAVAAGLTALGAKVERAGPPPCLYCERSVL